MKEMLWGGVSPWSRTTTWLPFRARLSSCSRLPACIDKTVAIVVRIYFGTVAVPLRLLDASLSPDVALLVNSAVSAL